MQGKLEMKCQSNKVIVKLEHLAVIYPMLSKKPVIRILVWAIYDLADTVFSMNVVSMYFPLLLAYEFGMQDIVVGFANSISQIAVAVLAPFLGTVSDKIGRKMIFFSSLAITSIVLTFTMTPLALTRFLAGFVFVFILANITYQLSLVFYNSLLPRVVEEPLWGRASGIGTSAGYLGAIVGLIFVMPFATGSLLGIDLGWGWAKREIAFVPTAILFAIFALPTLWFYTVDERESPSPKDISQQSYWQKVKEAIVDTKKYPGVLNFLIAHIFYQEAVETTIVFMGIFSQRVMGMPDNSKIMFFLIATTFAVLGSFLWGFITDKIGAYKSLILVLLGWIMGLLALVVSPMKPVYWVSGCWLGVMLGGVWTTSRPFLLKLVPPAEVGKFFGLYALTGKAAAVIGPLIWGAVVYFLTPFGDNIRYRSAIFSMALMVAVGMLFLLSKSLREKRN